jgi:hypothetical protein
MYERVYVVGVRVFVTGVLEFSSLVFDCVTVSRLTRKHQHSNTTQVLRRPRHDSFENDSRPSRHRNPNGSICFETECAFSLRRFQRLVYVTTFS